MTVHHPNDAFELEALMTAADDRLVVIDCFAQWCGPCKAIKPVFEEQAAQHPDATFIALDVDEHMEFAEAYGVTGLPTFLFFRSGRLLQTVTGANPATLADAIAQA
jgi:thioredoxin 1